MFIGAGFSDTTTSIAVSPTEWPDNYHINTSADSNSSNISFIAMAWVVLATYVMYC